MDKTIKLQQLSKRDLKLYNEGFLDGRADFFSEFLMLLEEELPQKKEAKREAIQ